MKPDRSGGERFLKKKYDLHRAPEVEEQAKRTERRTGEKVPQDPASRIKNYLERFSEILDREDEKERERGIEALKRVLYRSNVIKPEDIPERYFENQRRIARERGEGDIEITQEMRDQHAEVIIADQKSTLDTWVDYLSGPDAKYPDWLKYWATRSVLQMGDYDKGEKKFSKRSKGTTKAFPDLNREALAYVLDAVEKKYEKKDIDLEGLEESEQEKFQNLLQGENFPKLYAWAIEKATPASKEALTMTEGEWVKYDQGTDHMPLVESLQGHGTGWCTAGESTAKAQLEDGDFYVYYSKDEEGKYTIPRAAIRMEDDEIGEVRGIAEDQNLDPHISEVVQERMKEQPGGAEYEKKAEDMKRLTEIEIKTQSGGPLDTEDLRFLYEIDSKIEGFGYERDPRIDEIMEQRDARKDLSTITGFAEDEISLTKEEALAGEIRYHHGNLDLGDLESADGLTLPETVGGNLQLYGLETAKGMTLPKTVGGDLNMHILRSAKGMTMPDFVRGELNLTNLETAKGMTMPESVGGSLLLTKLETAKGLTLPESVGEDLVLGSMTSAKGVIMPESVEGNVILWGLKKAKGLILPKKVGGDVNLNRLETAKGLTLPESVGGDVNLNGLETAKGLTLPESVGGRVRFDKLPGEDLVDVFMDFEGEVRLPPQTRSKK